MFRSKRTQLTVERFCLPPDLGERVSRDSKTAAVKKTDLDF